MPKPFAAGRARVGTLLVIPALAAALIFAACSGPPEPLQVGFYAYFAPMSYSADEDPAAAGFNTHQGYEADLLSALEAMDGAGYAFQRRPIPDWPDIWLKSAAGAEFDLVGGGITIKEARTKDAGGQAAVAFTNGHVAFRQSLLVRSDDAARLAAHADLTSEVRVGAVAGTTGESRLLQLTGLTDAAGIIAAGARIETDAGEVVADGSADYIITASIVSPALDGRRRLHPPDATMPQVVYLDDEVKLLDALRNGDIDAVARGEIGNTDAAQQSNGAFVVTALDPAIEYGGFTVAAGNTELLARLNGHIDYLTDNRRIGYAEWAANRMVFMERAAMWEQ